MDFLYDREACRAQQFEFDDRKEFDAKYNVLRTWRDIEERILATWSPATIGRGSADGRGGADGRGSAAFEQSIAAARASLSYMFYKYRTFYYVRLFRSTDAAPAPPVIFYITNDAYVNPLYKRFLPSRALAAKYGIKTDPKTWIDYGGMVRTIEKEYDGYAIDFYYYHIAALLHAVAPQIAGAHCDFIISSKDRVCIKLDGTEASEELVGSAHYPLDKQFKADRYLPIMSFSRSPRYADLALPTPDDIQRVLGICTPPSCDVAYQSDVFVPWSAKTNARAVFRGSLTGPSLKPDKNQRLMAAMAARDRPDLLDVGLTNFRVGSRPRKDIADVRIHFFNMKSRRLVEKPPLSYAQQAEYKYVLYIEGNAAAYRGAYLFSMGSVVVWVRSAKFMLWFEHQLEDRVNCVFVRSDMSDLVAVLEWLRDHDDEAKKIAEAGRRLYDERLGRDGVMEYTARVVADACGLTQS